MLEGHDVASDREFFKSRGCVGKSREVGGRRNDSLHGLVDVGVHDRLLDSSCESDSARLRDFVDELVDVAECVPNGQFARVVLVFEGDGGFDFVHGIRVGDDAVHDLARVLNVNLVGLAELLSCEVGLLEIGLGCLHIVHLFIDE